MQMECLDPHAVTVDALAPGFHYFAAARPTDRLV